MTAESGAARELLWPGGAGDDAERRLSGRPRGPPPGRETARQMVEDGRAVHFEVLEITGAGIAGAGQHEQAGAAQSARASNGSSVSRPR